MTYAITAHESRGPLRDGEDDSHQSVILRGLSAEDAAAVVAMLLRRPATIPRLGPGTHRAVVAGGTIEVTMLPEESFA